MNTKGGSAQVGTPLNVGESLGDCEGIYVRACGDGQPYIVQLTQGESVRHSNLTHNAADFIPHQVIHWHLSLVSVEPQVRVIALLIEASGGQEHSPIGLPYLLQNCSVCLCVRRTLGLCVLQLELI